MNDKLMTFASILGFSYMILFGIIIFDLAMGWDMIPIGIFNSDLLNIAVVLGLCFGGMTLIWFILKVKTEIYKENYGSK